jgi:hypothetical protein
MDKNKIILLLGVVGLLIILAGCSSLVHFVEGDYRKDIVRLTKEQLKSRLDYGEPNSIQLTNKFGADEVWVYKKKIYRSDKTNYVTVIEKFYFKDDTLVAKEP